MRKGSTIMKLFRMIKCGIRDAFKSVYRNFSLSIASISCISITLLIVAIALVMSFNVKNFSKEIESDVTMVVFLNLGVTSEEISDFEALAEFKFDGQNEIRTFVSGEGCNNVC